MSSETDHPRQRTVAELLAEHGSGGASTGRRRRRRESDGDDGQPVDDTAAVTPAGRPPAPPVGGGAGPRNGGTPPVKGGPTPFNGTGIAPAAWAFPPAGPHGSGSNGAGPPPGSGLNGPDRSVLREPVPQEPVAREEYAAPDFSPRAYVPEPEPPRAAPPRRGRDNATDHFPRYREERTGVLDPGLTGPIEQLPRPALPAASSLDERTVEEPLVGSRNGTAEPLAGSRNGTAEPLAGSRNGTAEPLADPHADAGFDGDGGPATMVGAAPAGAEAWHRSRTGPRPDDGGPATQAAALPDVVDHPAGLDDEDGAAEPQRRLGRSSGDPSPGQAWAAVVAQWIVGAVGGAALWVGFRFLWRELPVVALAAAVLVTVGLVLIVRALLRNNDMRTTVFAVLVGLLLTVSPAILVLLGR